MACVSQTKESQVSTTHVMRGGRPHKLVREGVQKVPLGGNGGKGGRRADPGLANFLNQAYCECLACRANDRDLSPIQQLGQLEKCA